jgi:crotonobetainyl-CoA:carnitine CoA-transferase CaiB-like acyl-CoA transferase
LPGFASDDPRNSSQAWEGIIAAATGLYRPSPANPSSSKPTYTALPIASCYGAFQAAVSIAMALFARDRDGLGQYIEVPLFDAMFPVMGSRVLTMLDRPSSPPRPEVANWTRQYQCKDGRWIQFHSGNLNFQQFLESTGAAVWDTERFNKDELQEHIEALFHTRSAIEWEDLVADIGCEAAMCRTSDEWIQHPHAQASQAIISVNDSKFGPMLQPGISVRMSETPGEIRSGAPIVGEHQQEILREIENAVPDLVPQTDSDPLVSVLQGVKVLDLCIVLAGPTCGRTLAEFGAEVIKIDSPTRRRVVFHNDINRAKKSIVLDLKAAEGLKIFWKLLADADVVVQNLRKGVAERLGIGYEQVRARKPDIVYASLNTYGHVGPWAERPGHEQLAQAATGMQERYGGDGGPVLQPYAINDYGTGFMGAYGVALALLHRRRTGQGQHIDTALTYTACTLQSSYLQGYEGKKWHEPRGQNILGSGPLNRAYQATDGWFFLSAPPDALQAIERVNGIDSSLTSDKRDTIRLMEEKFIDASVDEWVRRLSLVGVSAHRIIFKPQELLEELWVKNHGLSITRVHEDIGRVIATGPAPRLSRLPVQVGRPAPRPGSDAPEILRAIGMENDFEKLVADGIICTTGIEAG